MAAAAPRPLQPPLAGPPQEPGPGALEGPRLRLAAARGTLGLELDEPFPLPPLRLAALSLTFPNIRFPIDLTGGVSRFRHRRGALAHLAVDLAASEAAAALAPKLRGLLADATPELWLSPFDGGIAVGIAGGDAALAFDVLILPAGSGLVLVPEHARGIGLGVAPHTLALRALAAALAGTGRVQEGALALPHAATMVLRAALPAAGARAPSLGGMSWEVARPEGDRLRLEASVDAGPPALPDRLVRASETLALCAEADDAAYRGELDAARDRYLSALERAPRHPEISERLAWLDAVSGVRPEAALSTLIDVMPAVDAGVLGGELLASVGDVEGARGALSRAARAEPFGPLAARTWLRAAALAEDGRERLAALDEAVVRAPALAAARWARLEARLAGADTRGALADAEHLEAAARGARARHEVARRAARAFLAEGFSKESYRLFERALRYAPDDAEAVAGLARALAAQGAQRRALDLFSRALALAERAQAASLASAVSIDLAKALVEVAGDRPAAVARVRGVPAGAPEAAEARLLEARWRAELGDIAGAGLAIGRLRDHVERDGALMSAPPGSEAAARAASVATLLVEAASIDERLRDDPAGAQRDLGLAMRLLPRDGRVAAAFRRVARESARRASPQGGAAGGAPAMPAPPRRAPATVRAAEAPPQPRIVPEVEAPPVIDVLPDVDSLPRIEAPGEETHSELDLEASLSEASEDVLRAADEALAERLQERLRGDPSNRQTVLELCEVLGRLGKELELFALVSARMDEGGEDERAALAPLRREVLQRLAAKARATGNASEAELYEMMLDAEGP